MSDSPAEPPPSTSPLPSVDPRAAVDPTVVYAYSRPESTRRTSASDRLDPMNDLDPATAAWCRLVRDQVEARCGVRYDTDRRVFLGTRLRGTQLRVLLLPFDGAPRVQARSYDLAHHRDVHGLHDPVALSRNIAQYVSEPGGWIGDSDVHRLPHLDVVTDHPELDERAFDDWRE